MFQVIADVYLVIHSSQLPTYPDLAGIGDNIKDLKKSKHGTFSRSSAEQGRGSLVRYNVIAKAE
ncbi:hypothetical protein E2542_SST15514 [Spatholobus suberectus]|nr:hypothetical protein E2542_SST15514 [Spatholobus suberectus]